MKTNIKTIISMLAFSSALASAQQPLQLNDSLRQEVNQLVERSLTPIQLADNGMQETPLLANEAPAIEQEKTLSPLEKTASAFTNTAPRMIAPNARLRADLNWLSNRGVVQLDLSTWPLSADEIRYALDRAVTETNHEAEVVKRIRQQIDGEKRFTISAQAQSERPLLPIGMDNPQDQYTVSGAVQAGSKNTDVRIQASALSGETLGRSGKADLAGSYAGVQIANQWLSVGQQERFWGHGHEGSLILGDSARPFTAVNLQRNVQAPFESKYLSWLGKWNYQIFAGQLRNKDDMKSPRNAKLIGMRLTWSPTPYLDFGAARVIQWGGEGRPQNWKTLGKALLGKGDNADTAEQRVNEPGNQLAGIDARIKLQPLLGVPVSVYGQMVGEDESGYMPSKNFFLMGVDGSHYIAPYQTLNWYVEGADTSTKFGKMKGVTYRHHIYRDGYYQQNMPLGYALGGDMRTVVVGVNSTRYSQDPKNWLQSQHFGGKVLYAQTLRRNHADETKYKGAELFWEGDILLKNKMSLSVGAKGWYTKPDNGKAQTGGSVKTSLNF